MNDIDQLFGFENSIYGRTHSAFYNCWVFRRHNMLFLQRDIVTGSPLLPSWNFWSHHIAGFEGLRQKEWTIITACLIIF